MPALADDIAEFCRRPDVSPATRTFYRDPLVRIFLPWAEGRGLVETNRVTPDVVDAYAVALEERTKRDGSPLALPTRRAYLKALQQFLAWVRVRKGVETVDSTKVPLPRLRRQPRDVLTLAEIDALELAAPIERDKLIVRVMARTGAREGEVAAIRTTDLISRDGRYFYLRLRGKTGERLAPIHRKLHRRLEDYAHGKSGRPRTKSTLLFMAHRRRNRGGYEPLTADGVYQALKGAAERADIGKRIYPHLLRHSAITHMVAEGMNIVTVSEIVGVSVAVIAQHYAHQTDEQRWDAMMRVYGE